MNPKDDPSGLVDGALRRNDEARRRLVARSNVLLAEVTSIDQARRRAGNGHGHRPAIPTMPDAADPPVLGGRA